MLRLGNAARYSDGNHASGRSDFDHHDPLLPDLFAGRLTGNRDGQKGCSRADEQAN
jgi:hypothetical protein